MLYADTEQSHVPFAASLEPSFFFSGAHRGEILNDLVSAIDEGDAICMVTGANGSGKSALVSELGSRIEHIAHLIFLPQPNLPAIDLYRAMAEQCGVTTGGLEQDDAIEAAVVETLQARRAQGRRSVVVVEEAQCAASATLRSLHRMCQSGGRDPWLQLLIFADSDAVETDALPRLLTPVSKQFELPAPSVEDTEDYCNQHLALAGWGAVDREFAEALHTLGKGSFRRINVLAASAVEHASAESAKSVELTHLRAAAKQFGFDVPTPFAFIEALRKLAGAAIESVPSVSLSRLSVPRVVVLPAACAMSAVLALMIVSPFGDDADSVALDDLSEPVLAKPELPTEQRMLDTAVVDQLVIEESQAAQQPVAVVEPETVSPAVASPAPESGSRKLGDPRLAPLGGAVARLATTLSDSGDGPFALRTGAQPENAFSLVQRIEPAALRLGASVETGAAKPQAAALQSGNPATGFDEWVSRSTDWLSASVADTYSIQLLLVSRDTQKLEDFIDQVSPDVDMTALRAFPTERDGRSLTLVVYGDYPSADAARQAIAGLPRGLRRLQPFVRSVGSLRSVVASI